MAGIGADSGADARLEQAVAWHVRLNSGEAGEDDWQSFTLWLAAAPENRLAYDHVEDLAAELDLHQSEILVALAAEGDTASLHQDVPLQGDTVINLDERRARFDWRRWGLALAAAAACLLVAVIGLERLMPSAPRGTEYATAVGEKSQVILADGSSVQLNTDTAIRVSFDDGERKVHLDHGEAVFDVAHDPARPFTVALGDRKVRVVGTMFNILRAGGYSTVTVARGVVQVSPRDGETPQAGIATLRAGDQLTHREHSSETTIRKVNPETVLAWRDGYLQYDDAPLGQVLSDLNRYFPDHVRSDNEAVSNLRFSGILKVDTEDAVLGRLEKFLPVAAEKQGHQVVLKMRRTAE